MTVDPLSSDRSELDQPDQKAMSNAKSWDAELAGIKAGSRKLAERQNDIVKIGAATIATIQKAGLPKVSGGRLKRIMAVVKTLGVDDVRELLKAPARAGSSRWKNTPFPARQAKKWEARYRAKKRAVGSQVRAIEHGWKGERTRSSAGRMQLPRNRLDSRHCGRWR